jgi:hypothetical protein
MLSSEQPDSPYPARLRSSTRRSCTRKNSASHRPAERPAIEKMGTRTKDRASNPAVRPHAIAGTGMQASGLSPYRLRRGFRTRPSGADVRALQFRDHHRLRFRPPRHPVLRLRRPWILALLRRRVPKMRFRLPDIPELGLTRANVDSPLFDMNAVSFHLISPFRIGAFGGYKPLRANIGIAHIARDGRREPTPLSSRQDALTKAT